MWRVIFKLPLVNIDPGDTTDFRRVECHFQATIAQPLTLKTPPTLVAWSFNFGLRNSRNMLNLTLHTAEAGGVQLLIQSKVTLLRRLEFQLWPRDSHKNAELDTPRD